MTVSINCDMGESFGLYTLGNDESIMPLINEANVACGFHASDPNHMHATVLLAKKHAVKVGAHFSLPDLMGFGRREMKISRDELFNIIMYQIGALKAFLDMAGMPLNHLKPHGALYGMAAKDEAVAHAVADAALQYNVPVFGLADTVHEKVYTQRGLEFRAEFFADLDYDENGKLLITSRHEKVSPEKAALRVSRALKENVVECVSGKDVPIRADTVCVHSDTAKASEILLAIRKALAL